MTTYTVKVTYGQPLRQNVNGATWGKLTRKRTSALVSRIFNNQYDRPETISVTTVREVKP